MLLFLSFSGETSKRVATQLRAWIPRVLTQATSWLSSEDIEPGDLWLTTLLSKLRKAGCGIICLTPSNSMSTWIHFESGVLSRALPGRVFPVVFGMSKSDVQRPLSSFQSIAPEKADFLRMLLAINKQSKTGKIDEQELESRFAAQWDELETQLAAIEVEYPLQAPTPIEPTTGSGSASNLALYDRRLPIYRATQEFLESAIAHGNAQLTELTVFRQKTDEALFLFNEAIAEYLENLWKIGAELRTMNVMLKDGAYGSREDRMHDEYKKSELLRHIHAQLLVGRRLFLPFLRVDTLA